MSEEEIGYGKPPKKHQFKKGTSGNPRGRPKGKKSFAARFQKFLDEKITVNINGRPEKLTKEDAFLKRVINDAIAGKPGATNQLISLKQMVSAMPNTEGMSASERNKLDQALLESFMQLLGPDWKSKLEGG